MKKLICVLGLAALVSCRQADNHRRHPNPRFANGCLNDTVDIVCYDEYGKEYYEYMDCDAAK